MYFLNSQLVRKCKLIYGHNWLIRITTSFIDEIAQFCCSEVCTISICEPMTGIHVILQLFTQIANQTISRPVEVLISSGMENISRYLFSKNQLYCKQLNEAVDSSAKVKAVIQFKPIPSGLKIETRSTSKRDFFLRNHMIRNSSEKQSTRLKLSKWFIVWFEQW